MPWLQLTINAEQNQVELIENLFESLGAEAITYGDAAEQVLLEPKPGETKLWHLNRITALFAADTDIQALHTAVNSQLPLSLAATLESHILEDQIWERVWLADFPMKRFGTKLWVCPANLRPDQTDAITIDLDPGLAFGTGTHPTTALCLTWLDQADIQGQSVLDYGCGSGILAIAAARLGSRQVTAVDYDPQALEATQSNAAKNNITTQLLRIYPPELCPQDPYNCVIANILAGTLITLEPQLAKLTCTGGRIVLSGILDYQAAGVLEAYQQHFVMDAPQQEQEWILLTGIRRPD